MSNQVTLFQNESGTGPSQKFGALTASGVGMDLGDGIRSSYAILSIKAGRWRIKYKGQETPIMAFNQQSQRQEPVPTLEMVIIKANPFLNKQFYSGKYVEGSTAPPDCYSLDGKVPSASVAKPVHSNCATCPKNQWGSMVGDNGVKQKACRDTKKLAVVPLGDIRNGALGGAMLFRVPPSALKDLSALSDAMKARGFPYNSIAVRFGFDMDASHPKPTFTGIRPLNDDEADAVLEMFESDSVAAVLADNDVVVEHSGAAAAANTAGQFEQEPVTPAGMPAAPTRVQVPPELPNEPPVRLVAEAVPPPPPGMRAAVVQPLGPGGLEPAWPTADLAAQQAARDAETAPRPQAPPSMIIPGVTAPATPQPAAPPAANPFFSNVPAQPAAPAKAPAPRKPRPAPVEPVAVQTAPVEPVAAATQLDSDIGNILAGLSAFTGGK